MVERRWDWERGARWAPLSGVLAVALWLVGAILVQDAAPGEEATGQEILSFFQEDETRIALGVFLFALGVLAFVWFLGSLRNVLFPAEGGTARLSTLSFASGIAVAVSLMLFGVLPGAGALHNDELTSASAEAIYYLSAAFFIAAEMFGAAFLFATALAALKTGVLPRWLAWLTLLLAVWLVIFPIGWIGLLIGFPLWVLVTSTVLWRQARPAAAEPVRTQPAP